MKSEDITSINHIYTKYQSDNSLTMDFKTL